MRRFRAVSTLVLVIALCAFPVHAARPTIEYLDVEPGPYTFSGICAFDVIADLNRVGNKEKIATFYNQAGEVTFQILTGANQWRFTNADTGNTININASGPGRFLLQPGTDVVRFEGGGVSFFFFEPGTQPPGWPVFPLTRGRIVADLDPTTFTISNVVVQHGTVEDICALLE